MRNAKSTGQEAPGGPGQPFRLLFVCTGNTCRSPLAEAIARREAERRGWTTLEVGSAGVAAFPGGAASQGSLVVGERHGLDLSSHRSRPLTPELLAEVDLVLTMSESHLAMVDSAGGADRAELVTRFVEREEGRPDTKSGVPDPFGGPIELYEETYEALESLVRRALDRLAVVIEP